MMNEVLSERLAGMLEQIMGLRRAGRGLSNATKGRERETYLDTFLADVLPRSFRVGSGDILDHLGSTSGQLDLVVEFPYVPSFPAIGTTSPRLYLAEGVAAVIEVKSDVAGQWSEVKHTAQSVHTLQRSFTSGSGRAPDAAVPLFAVGYEGWKSAETLADRLQDRVADCILVIDPPMLVSHESLGGLRVSGPRALWGFITCLHRCLANFATYRGDISGY
jgi:hypothetical protein